MPMPEILLGKCSFHYSLSGRDDEEKIKQCDSCVSERSFLLPAYPVVLRMAVHTAQKESNIQRVIIVKKVT